MQGKRTVKQSLAKAAYEHVKAAICDGTIRQGELLSESRIAEELGMSRTPVREALAPARERRPDRDQRTASAPTSGPCPKGTSTTSSSALHPRDPRGFHLGARDPRGGDRRAGKRVQAMLKRYDAGVAPAAPRLPRSSTGRPTSCS